MPPAAFPDPVERTSQRPSVVAVIPARYASTRLPGKPLADIAGRPMIEYVYRRTAEARGVEAVIVATDDERIAAAVRAFGGVARLTGSAHRTGTDRIAELARELECDVLVNVQGDLPLVEPAMIAEIVNPLRTDPGVRMSTACRAIDNPADHTNPHVVKVVTDRRGNALYFSRAPIPYVRGESPAEAGPSDQYVASGFSRTDTASGIGRTPPVFRHIGIYAYRREFLLTLAALPRTPLEEAESLEQLRALEHGFPIRVVETAHESFEVDTLDDLERVRRMVDSRSPSLRGRDTGVTAPARA